MQAVLDKPAAPTGLGPQADNCGWTADWQHSGRHGAWSQHITLSGKLGLPAVASTVLFPRLLLVIGEQISSNTTTVHVKSTSSCGNETIPLLPH